MELGVGVGHYIDKATGHVTHRQRGEAGSPLWLRDGHAVRKRNPRAADGADDVESHRYVVITAGVYDRAAGVRSPRDARVTALASRR